MAILTALPGGVQAQTLSALLGATYENNPHLSAMRERKTSSLANVDAARGQRWPTVNVTGQEGRRHLDQRTAEETLTDRQVRLELSLDLWRSGQISAGIEKANAGVAQTDAQLTQTSIEALKTVAINWLSLKSAEQIIVLQRDDIAERKDFVEQLKTRVARGLATVTDLSAAQLAVIEQQTALQQTEEQRIQALDTLEKWSGLRPKQTTGTALLPEVPMTLEAALSQAATQATQIQIARGAVAQAQAEVAEREGAIGPQLSLNAHHGYEYDQTIHENVLEERAVSREQSTGVMLELTVPLTDGGSRRAQIRASTHALAAARLHLRAAQEDTAATVRNSWTKRASAQNRIALLEQQLSAATALQESRQREFNQGLIDIQPLLDANQKRSSTEQDLIHAHTTLQQSEVQLLADIGALTPERLGLQ
ncbi:MAG: TolC family protein [Gammaproteobacteria bacterium]|nr:TolC family protein [Gammaproteobacteria bacterium]